MKVIRFKMYSGFIVSFICIMIGAYMVVASPNKSGRDAFFIFGLISGIASLLYWLLNKKVAG